MSISRDTFEFVNANYGLHASWAIWTPAGVKPKSNMDDLSAFDSEDVLLKLQPNIILVGLNHSKAGVVNHPFQNFHSSGGGDYKIRYALEGTPVWGAYMTDIIKDFPEKESKNVVSYLRANPSVVTKNVMSFQQELQDVGADKPTIITFGGDAFNILEGAFGSDHGVLKVIHYSHYMSKEKYREHIALQIDKLSL